MKSAYQCVYVLRQLMCWRSSWILILLVWSLSVTAGATEGEPKLVLAQILFRHGMRAPEEPYPTDPFQDASVYWPNGWGQLTDYGKEQQYQLGKFLRHRYASLLSPHYVPEEILVVSSSYDRTVASALLMLVGLYPNTAGRNQYEYSRLAWQPIPIQTLNPGSNKLMLHPSYISKPYVCPRAYELIQAADSHPLVKKALEENRELIENLKNWTGIGESKSWKHIMAGYMGGVQIEKFYNLSIPKWADDVISSPSNLQLIASVYAYLSLTPEMKRLLAGPILSEWVHNMRNRSDASMNKTSTTATAKTKLYVYSAHDLNLVNVLNTMGLNDPPMVPSMGSTLFVELYDNSEVRLSYRDGISRQITALKVPGCEEPCTLNSFEHVVKPYLVEDLDQECGVSLRAAAGSLSALEGVLIAIICILALMLFGLEVYHRKVRNKSKMYAIESK